MGNYFGAPMWGTINLLFGESNMQHGGVRMHAKIGWTLMITQGEKHRSNVVSRGSVLLYANFDELPDEMDILKDLFDE